MKAALAHQFLQCLLREGYDFFTGVPCSLLSQLWWRLERLAPEQYVPAVREDSALGMAAGAWLGGRRPCVLMQNSGLATAMNAIVSLHQTYEIPVLLVVTWRGEGGRAGIPAGSLAQPGFVDAPEHVLTGERLSSYFDTAQVPFVLLEPRSLDQQVREAANRVQESRRPAALVVRKGVFDGPVSAQEAS